MLMEIYTKGEGINQSYVFFESDLSRVLKPMIWVYTKFEQNGKEKPMLGYAQVTCLMPDPQFQQKATLA